MLARRFFTPSFWITVIGAVGFVGLLVVSAYAPAQATLVRVAALIWFVLFGALSWATASPRERTRRLDRRP